MRALEHQPCNCKLIYTYSVKLSLEKERADRNHKLAFLESFMRQTARMIIIVVNLLIQNIRLPEIGKKNKKKGATLQMRITICFAKIRTHGSATMS